MEGASCQTVFYIGDRIFLAYFLENEEGLMEENSYKENLMESSLATKNGAHDDISGGFDEGSSEFDGVEEGAHTGDEGGLLYIPVGRLILLSVLTFGVYCYYWQFRNWVCIKERDGLSIRPFWRAWFWLFFVYALLKAMKSDACYSRASTPSFSPLLLTIGAVIAESISQTINQLPYNAETIAVEMVALMLIGAHLFFIPVQRHVNRCERILDRGRAMKSAWSKGHLFCYVWTILALVVGLLSGLA